MGAGKSGSVSFPQANAITQANSQPAVGAPNRYSQTVGMGSGWDQAKLGAAVRNPLAGLQGKGYGGKVSPSMSQTQPTQQPTQPVDTGSNNYY